MRWSQWMRERTTRLRLIWAGASETGISYCTSALNSDDNLVLIARDADEVVRHLVARLRGPSSVHPIRVADLESIHVYAGHRNRGVGEQLMTAFLSWAGKKGAQLLAKPLARKPLP